ncbi:MAG: OmpA family protein [Clostridiales bacterium]|nr:OmpA family protein [Clostridiales bacterium]
MSRRRKNPPKSAGSPWITTFADLMNLLLCFFVLLFSMSSVDDGKYEKVIKSISSSFSIHDSTRQAKKGDRVISTGIRQNQGSSDSAASGDSSVAKDGDKEFESELLNKNKDATLGIYDEIVEDVNNYGIADGVNLEIDANYRYVLITLDGHILFDPGKAELKEESYQLLDNLADILKKFTEGQIIEIEGHTDNVPISRSIYPTNELLSSARAINAATYLIEEKGFNPANLKWTGRGEYDPVAPNTTSEGRAKNRRIEIKVHNNINQ